MERERKQEPCAKARSEGVPCFPVTTDLVGPVFSVRKSLEELGTKGGPSPNRPPTTSEMAPFRPGSRTPIVPLASFDAVCAVKAAVKALKGKNHVYYLYRVGDPRGAHAALYDHKLDPAGYQGDVEFLGRLDGECEALTAYRALDRELQSEPQKKKKP